MPHHLGVAGGAGGEEHQHGVGGLVRRFACGARELLALLRDQRVEVEPFLTRVLVLGHAVSLHARALGHRLVDVIGGIAVAGDDHHLDGRGVGAVDIVLRRQQVRGGDGDRADAVQRQQRVPELIAALEHEHHAVALFDAVTHQEIGGLVGKAAQVLKGEATLLALVADPEHGQLIGGFLGDDVHHIVAVIEVVADGHFIVFLKVFQRGKVVAVAADEFFIQRHGFHLLLSKTVFQAAQTGKRAAPF